MSSESPGVVNKSTSLNMFTRGLVIEGNIARRGNIKLSDPNLIKLKNEIKKPLIREWWKNEKDQKLVKQIN